MSNTNETTRKENKMGVLPIPKLLITMSLPIIISMFVQALYNVIDSMFVAKLNEEALTAVSLAFPVQNLIIAVGVGTAVGVNALLSRRLGEHRFEEANQFARNGIFLAVLSYLLFAVIGIFCSHTFFAVQTDNTRIVTYGTSYMTVVTVLSFGVFIEIMMERLLQATGKTIYTMLSQGAGAIINIILDPILIFGLFGFPRMEVAGAAVATVVGQICAACISILFNVFRNREISINMKQFRPQLHIIKEIYQIGVPSIIMQSIGSVMTFGMNKILLVFSSTAAAVFGVYFKLQSFIFMPVFGLNNGMIPIVSYNYGARNKKRIIHTVMLSTGIAVGIMALGTLLFQTIPDKFLLLFDASEHMLEIGIPALRIISISFVLAGYCIVISSMFQALGNSSYSLLMSLVRQLFVLLPVAFLFARLFGLSAVWWAFPISELASLILCTCLLFRVYRKKIAPLGD